MFRPAKALLILLLLAASAFGQITVCQLFKDLTAANGQHLTVSGELAIDGELIVLTAPGCEYDYMSRPPNRQLWNANLQIETTSAQAAQFKNANAHMSRIRKAHQTMSSRAVLSGRVNIIEFGDFAAQLILDSIESITIEPLPDARTLPVIPICDLFKDLESWRDRRIAIRGEFSSTGEGTWVYGNCKGLFFTNGYRWPVAFTFYVPRYSANPAPLLHGLGPSDRAGQNNIDLVRQEGTFVGRLVLRETYIAYCPPFGEYRAIGFDHLGGSTGRLIIESVRDVKITRWRPSDDGSATVPQKCDPNQNKVAPK